MKEKLTAHDVWYWNNGTICKMKFNGGVKYYYNTHNGRFIYQGKTDKKWHGKRSLILLSEDKKHFETEHEACKWLLKCKQDSERN